jgi:hypothetical protein
MTRVDLCTSAQVLQTARFNTADEAGGSDVVTEAIEEANIEVTNDYGDPAAISNFSLLSTHTKYEFRNDNVRVYRIDRVVIYDDNHEQIVYTADTSASETGLKYVQDLEFNTITFHADTIAKYDGRICVVHYLPYSVHLLARTKAALFLLDRSNVTNGAENTPTLGVRLIQRIGRIEEAIQSDLAVGSEENKWYDPTYGVTIRQLRQKYN